MPSTPASRSQPLAPNPGPQWDFLSSLADEVLFGGAAGGGKSFALLIWAALGVEVPSYRCLLVRRTYRELEMSLIDESRRIYPRLRGAPGVYNEQRRTWSFPHRVSSPRTPSRSSAIRTTMSEPCTLAIALG